jgi:hypothetical protein
VEVVMLKRALVMATATALFLVPACGGATRTSSQIAEDEPRVREVLDTYLRSVDTADVALASEVWAQGPKVEAVTPFGRFTGWDRVRDGLYVNFLQKMFSKRSLTPSNVSVSVAGDVA